MCKVNNNRVRTVNVTPIKPVDFVEAGVQLFNGVGQVIIIITCHASARGRRRRRNTRTIRGAGHEPILA
jgi:hypothetical protein